MPRRRTSPVERLLPMVYVGVAVLIAALLLPTILRPPQDLQNTTAAFSPDAPPEDTPPEALLQSLRQASSSTAGAVEEVVIEEEIVVERTPVQRRAVRGGCYGDPPRQTESLYSALCVPAWTGDDNGGATTKGVTADEIKVAIGVPASTAITEGKLGRDFEPDDGPTEHELKVWQVYFNDRFEFYGRYLQFYVIKVDSTDEDLARAAVRAAVTNYGVFAYLGHYATTNAAATNEAIRQKLVTFAFDNNPVDFYRDNHPWVYSFEMDSWQTRFIGSEMACKQYAGKPPGSLNGEQDPTFDYTKPRKWGLIIYQDEVRTGARKMYEDQMAKCGVRFEPGGVAEYNLNDNSSQIAGSVTKLRQAGVTTIILAVDPLTPAAVAYEADRTGYSPEWLCITGCATNGTGRLLPDNQSLHFVAMSFEEIPRADADKDWYRAFKEIDPEGEPAPEYFRELQQFSGAVQHSGPTLTPDAFWKGLRAQPCRTPDPIWSIGGCYSDPNPQSDVHYLGDYTYSDYVSFMWMDNTGDDPDSSSTGAWCYMNMGTRYRYKEVPTEPLPFRDPERCIITPPRGEQG